MAEEEEKHFAGGDRSHLIMIVFFWLAIHTPKPLSIFYLLALLKRRIASNEVALTNNISLIE